MRKARPEGEPGLSSSPGRIMTNHRDLSRSQHAGAYVSYVRPGTRMSRTCSKCEAAPGYRCGQWGSLGWVTLKKPHKER